MPIPPVQGGSKAPLAPPTGSPNRAGALRQANFWRPAPVTWPGKRLDKGGKRGLATGPVYSDFAFLTMDRPCNVNTIIRPGMEIACDAKVRLALGP
jgi:hypothetical protein